MAAALTAALAAPAAAQDREQLQMLAELRMIQEQSGQLRALIATLEETLKALNTKLDQQADANRKTAADQKLQMDGLRDTVSVLREKLDDTNVRISTLSHEVQTLRGSMTAIQQAQQAAAAAAAANPPAGDPAAPQNPPAQPAAPAAGLDAKRTFDTAMGDYLSGAFALAVDGFQAYIRTFPTAPAAAQAQYYIGESLFQLQRFQEAVTEYGKVIDNYKTSEWVPEALYKQGQSFERLKDFARARQAYEAVIKSHPDSNAAMLAKQKLPGLPR
jgi:tol-pal system protein YbgF